MCSFTQDLVWILVRAEGDDRLGNGTRAFGARAVRWCLARGECAIWCHACFLLIRASSICSRGLSGWYGLEGLWVHGQDHFVSIW